MVTLALSHPSGSTVHIHGHGPLGDLYPDYKGGDIWSSRLGQVRGIKEGDTPSFLSLVPNGLTDVDHPWPRKLGRPIRLEWQFSDRYPR